MSAILCATSSALPHPRVLPDAMGDAIPRQGRKASKRRQMRARRAIAPAQGTLGAIEHFVVLMLENRSFDHLLGYLKETHPAIAGMSLTDFNYEDPITKSNPVEVCRSKVGALSFDPVHEFDDVDVQINGPTGGRIPMGGFVCSSVPAGGGNACRVMECFQPDQIPVLAALAEEFAVFNYWYSPMPGSTWPNRFFVHASTSGGLFESPDYLQMGLGFRFAKGTIYDQLDAARQSWRVYHHDDFRYDFPQVIGIRGMLRQYRSARFGTIDKFYSDIRSGVLPAYSFIEPSYDVFNDFARGNSMHPEADVGPGERLVKEVYEAIRNSGYWPKAMLVITFDEHGGFYDHVVPPAAPPTGDDTRYASRDKSFAFDRYGVRVPTIVVSAYTDRRTVIGNHAADPSTIFDHTAIPATVQKRFGLKPLSKRDGRANTLDVALNRASPRSDAPKRLPAVAAAGRPARPRRPGARAIAPSATKPLTKDQKAFLALAMAVDREMNPHKRMNLADAALITRTPAQAAAYAARVQAQALASRRKSPAKRKSSRKRSKRRK